MAILTPLDEEAEKAKERIIEMNSRLYDRAAAYTNLMMIKNSIYFWEFSSKLGQIKSPREFIEKYNNFTKDSANQNISFFKFWAASVIFCIATALLAIAILFYEFFVLLLPPWSS